MRAWADTTGWEAVAGSSQTFEIEVTNTDDVIDGVTIHIDGLDPRWYSLREPVLRLFPGETGVIAFKVDAPRDGSMSAGRHEFTATVLSMVDQTRRAPLTFAIEVPSVEAVSVSTVPSIVTGGRKGALEAFVRNEGNTPTTYLLGAHDQTGELDCRIEPDHVDLVPGQREKVAITMKGRRPWFGSHQTRLVTVRARSVSAPDQDEVEFEAAATFHQRPRIARGVLTFLMLAAIVAVWAMIFIFFILARGESPAKAGPDADADTEVRAAAKLVPFSGELFTGETNVARAAIGATATGVVTDTVAEAPLPRIAVRAMRIVPGDALVLTGEAATGEDGSFALEGLIPGNYAFIFSGVGFERTLLCGTEVRPIPAATGTVGGFEPTCPTEVGVRLLPKETLTGLDVALSGRPGSISGTLLLPGADDSGQRPTPTDLEVPSFTVAWTQLGPNGQEMQPLAEATPVPIVDGAFELPGLITPATYRLVVRQAVDPAAAEFSAAVFEVSLVGGEQKVIEPIRPSASPGAIRGNVGLGGVTVVVDGADFHQEVVTPTGTVGEVGLPVGEFEFIGLPTPGDYVVSFSKEGYSDVTIALPLAAGETRTIAAGVVTLQGGVGQLVGRVMDASGGLGGVEVTVEGVGFSGAATSLTQVVGGRPVGAFAVGSVPVPGTYTITFRREGYESTSIRRPVSGATTELPDVTLSRSVGRVEGTVRFSDLDAGLLAQQLAAIEVRLGDGEGRRMTTLATEPAGRFTFPDVPPGVYTVSFFDGDGPNPIRVLLRTVRAGATADASTTIAATVRPSVATPRAASQPEATPTVPATTTSPTVPTTTIAADPATTDGSQPLGLISRSPT